MADAITIQGMIDAGADVETLGEAANEDKVVVSRLGREYPSAPMAARIILEQGTIDAFLFLTKADLDTGNALGSDTPITLVDDDFGLVLNDETLNNNGYYQMRSGELVWLNLNASKQALAEIEQAKQAAIAAAATDATNKASTAVTQANSYTNTSKADTLSKVQNTFDTKSQMVGSPLPDNSKAFVDNDTTANNGYYKKVAGIWNKTAFAPVAQANAYTDNKTLPLLNIFDTKAQMVASVRDLNTRAKVLSDNTADNNGYYKKEFVQPAGQILTLTSGISPVTTTSGWIKDRVTLEAVNGIGIITMTGAAKDGLIRHSFDIGAGDTAIIKARIRVLDSECVALRLGNSSNGGYINVLNPVNGQWYDMSGLRTRPTAGSLDVFIIPEYATASAAAGKKIEVQYVTAINLTPVFTGGIPTLAQLDAAMGSHASPYTVDTNSFNEGIADNGWVKMVDAVADAEYKVVSNISSITNTAAWVQGRATLATSDGIGVMTLDGSSFDGFIRHNYYADYDHKILIKARVRVLDSECINIAVGNSADTGYMDLPNPTANQWIDVSYIRQPKSSGDLPIFIVPTYPSAAIAAGKKLEIEYVSVIDLTLQFPDGIPKLEVLNKILGDHASPYVVNFKDLANYTFNLVATAAENTIPSVGAVSPDNVFEASLDVENGIDTVRTAHSLEVYSALYPEVKPITITNYGKRPNQTYAASYMNMSTHIYREAWGMQMTLNGNKTRYPDTTYPVKDVKSVNTILLEWGVEGLSCHICPPEVDYGDRAWMAFKIGGMGARSATNFETREGTKIQSFAPHWIERSDKNAKGWTQQNADTSVDNATPTVTHIRVDASFDAPEHYNLTVSDIQQSAWNRDVRMRGTLTAPEAAINDDHVAERRFTVVTGLDADGHLIHKDIAREIVVYVNDGGALAARWVKQVWNNTTSAWQDA